MAIRIGDDHRIVGAGRLDLATPRGALAPTRIVLHYSGGSTLRSAVNTLRQRGLSYHVLIDTDGSLHQVAPFDRPTSHAGRSNWKAVAGLANGATLNGTAIGISMINLGRFDYLHGGRWYWGYSAGEPFGPNVADADANKHAAVYEPGRWVHWSAYPPAQLAACRALVEALAERYPAITELVGHHDIAIGDKADPGPLCPLESWRQELGLAGGLGLSAAVRSPDREVNLRDRPGVEGRILRVLHNDDVVHIRSVAYVPGRRGLVPGNGRALGAWASVDADGSNRHAGFVHLRYLDRTPLSPAYAAKL